MKRKLTFVSLLTVLVLAISFSSALATDIDVKFNNVNLANGNVIAVSPGEVVPVLVLFTADESASDVTLEVEIKGRNGVSVQKEISDIRNGSIYSSDYLKLKLPEDIDELAEEFTLYVTISSPTKSKTEKFDVAVSVQRKSYDLEVLSVDYSSKVAAGNTFPITVVAKNVGYNRADDVYVKTSVPALGISTRGYIGDMIPVEDYKDYDDEEDSVEKVVNLQVPKGSESGVYELVVEVYNKDSSVKVSKLISVDGIAPSTDGKTEELEGESETPKISTSVVALTVILAIIFVVLLTVLVVLLTKKEKPIEEVETSYY